MRKLENKMVQAIRNSKLFSDGNTKVLKREYDPALAAYRVQVYLHGNRIANVLFRTADSKVPFMIVYNLCGWNTPTTRSRINAIIKYFGDFASDGIRTRKGTVYAKHNGAPEFSIADNVPVTYRKEFEF